MTLGILPNAKFFESESGCKFGNECSILRTNRIQSPNRVVTKVQWLSARCRQLGCVSQDAEPPESSAILRKGTKVLGPIRRVRFTRAALRQANIRENKGPSHGKIQVNLPHQRSYHAVKFVGRSQEETERQQRCARGDAWRLAKNVYKLKEEDKATVFRLPMSGVCRPHPQ